MYRNILSLLVTLVLALPSSAGVIITSWGVPTIGLPAFSTYTLTATTDNGDQIVGFDFASQRSFGIIGSLNQVNPFGLLTIFQDNNAVLPFVGADVSQDSQFKFKSTDLVVPAGFAEEGPTKMRAVFASSVTLGTTVPFVQLAISNSSAAVIYFAGTITTVRDGSYFDVPVSGIVPCLECYPPAITDALIDNIDADVPGTVNHMLAFSNPYLSGSLSNFRFDSYVSTGGGTGAGPAVPATFDYSTGQFHWNTVGSPLGTYKWLVTATSRYGTDEGSITVRITVPEPVAALLMGLGLAGYLATTRPRRWHNRKCYEN